MIMTRHILSCIVIILGMVSSVLAVPGKDVVVDGNLTKIPLGNHLAYYLDHDRELTIDGISSPGFQGRFRSFTSETPSLGYSSAALWARFVLVNPETSATRVILEYAYPAIDDVSLYIPEKKGFSVKRGGDRHPASIKEIPSRTITFPLDLEPGRHVCYGRITSSGSMVVAMNLYERNYFRNQQVRDMTFFGLYFGVMLALVAYNLLIFFAMKETSFILLALFSLSLTIYSAVHAGIAYHYIWPENPDFANISYPLFLSLSIVLAIQFSRNYLATASSMRTVDRVLQLALLFGFFAAASPLFLDYYHSTHLSIVYSLVTIMLLLSIGTFLFFRGARPAIFYLAAWAIIMIGGAYSAGGAFGLLHESLMTDWSYQIGSPLLILLLSLGVSDKINTMRKAHAGAMAAMSESEAKYRTVIDSAHDGIMVIIDHRLMYVNNSLVTMLGYSQQELLGRDFLDLFPETEMGKSMVENIYRERMNGMSAPSRYECQMLTSRGDIVDTMISAAVAVFGGFRGSIAIISDISAQNQSRRVIVEQFEKIQHQYRELEVLNTELNEAHARLISANRALLDEKEQLAATLSAIGDAVIVYNDRGLVQLMNSNAEELTGWSCTEALGAPASEVVRISDTHAADRIFRRYPLEYDSRGLDTIGIPFAMTDRHNHEKIIEINGSHIRINDCESGGVVLAIRDITGKVRLEKEILNMNKMESLGVLAGGIAHDFNNLLTAVTGNASLARSLEPGDGPVAHLLEKIEQAGRRAINLTHQLLTFSKGGEPVKKALHLDDLVRESAALILSGSKIKTRFDFDPVLLTVDADPGQISQVFNNIIINAMQAMPGGGMLVIKAENVDDISGRAPLPGGPYVAVSFTDHGMGIHREYLNRIFDPYFTTKQGGPGLGLASSYSIIKKHDGYIGVVSEPGRGTVFTVFLKASSNDAPRESKSAHRKTPGEGAILVLDDEEMILDVTSQMLEHLGYRADRARDGREAAVRYLAAREKGDPYRAVIMDLTIPGGMGGRECLDMIRKSDPDVIAIVSSGYSEDPVMSHFEKYGFRGVLMKPYTLQEVALTLDSVMKDDRD